MKIDTEDIRQQVDSNIESYQNIIKTVSYLLQQEINKNGIKIHAIEKRIKDLSSIINKMRRKKIKLPFQEIHDLIGFRVVCLFRQDLDKIKIIIQEIFDVFEEDDKIHDLELDVFGYMSLHIKAHLKSSNQMMDDEWCKKYPFEIQVRTIAQDAWASISHHLDYKKETTIPPELMKDFNALSGLFYVADTHFEIIKQEQTKISMKES